jgi:hypothetical protein
VLNNTASDAAIYSSRNITLSGTSNGNVTVVSGASTGSSFANPWGIALGNLNVKGLTAFASNAGTAGGIATIAVTNGGAGYTGTPSVTISGLGSGAAATAVQVGGVITAVTITNAGTGFFTTPPTITFGQNGSAQATATLIATGNATSGSSGNITQSTGANAHVENTVDLVTFNGNVVVGNNGNSFGRVQASTGGASGLAGTGDITIVEDSTLKVGLIATQGNATLTSRFGSVIEDPIANVTITANGTSSVLTVSAPSGSVQLGGVTRTSGTTTGNVSGVSINASGSAQVSSTANLTLSAMSANSLSVTANNISQSGPLNIFGLSTFNATNSISLTNTANNFGPLVLISNTANQSISVVEGNTLNLRSMTMPGNGNGTVSLTSVSGDIIDTGLGGARLGGNIVSSTPIYGQGVVTLSAINGNIILDDPTTDVLTSTGVVFNSRNVTISVLGSPGSNLVLGATGQPSVATGNLIASSALGNIGNAGPLTVSGNAFFQTGNGNITIGQSSNVGFGSVRFVGNQVSIQESGNMDILTGSTAFGPANLISGGSIAISDVGGGPVTFGNIVNMSATSGATLRLMQAVGQLSVTSSGTKDLSALSISTDLNGKTPIFGGTGANVDPKP